MEINKWYLKNKEIIDICYDHIISFIHGNQFKLTCDNTAFFKIFVKMLYNRYLNDYKKNDYIYNIEKEEEYTYYDMKYSEGIINLYNTLKKISIHYKFYIFDSKLSIDLNYFIFNNLIFEIYIEDILENNYNEY
tara:strand:+ start:7325 stop:7726 length:402 start_codon:yes stop_codon:yes gene_type:complete